MPLLVGPLLVAPLLVRPLLVNNQQIPMSMMNNLFRSIAK